jgi:hypothetical protein
MPGKIDFDRINLAALAALPALCARWLPDGCRRGREWIARNPRRLDRSHRGGSAAGRRRRLPAAPAPAEGLGRRRRRQPPTPTPLDLPNPPEF